MYKKKKSDRKKINSVVVSFQNLISDEANVGQMSRRIIHQSDSIDYRCDWLEPRAGHHAVAGSLCILMQVDRLAQSLIYTEVDNIRFQHATRQEHFVHIQVVR